VKRFYILLLTLTVGGVSLTIDDLKSRNGEALGCIKGIGPKKAKVILDYVKENNVTDISELINAYGVGEKTLYNIINDVKKKSCSLDIIE